PVLDASVPDGTRAVLERILEADATTRVRVARLRPGARSSPSAALVLDDVESLLTRIDALVAAEQVQTLRPSAPEVTMLEGIAAPPLRALLSAPPARSRAGAAPPRTPRAGTGSPTAASPGGSPECSALLGSTPPPLGQPAGSPAQPPAANTTRLDRLLSDNIHQ